MAKRAAAGKGDVTVNVSKEVRALVEGNQEIRGPEVIANLKERFPTMVLNENSVQVAFANARRKLGLTRTIKKRPGKRKVGRPVAAVAAPATASAGVNMQALTAAKELLKACGGDLAAAQTAIRQMQTLMN
ncbi:MAG: hypothetical protein ACK5TG_13935 [Planctomyces sp.]|jgi:hypothetical protein|nr:hypothetical protein [Planctomycetaceae bacterium]HBC60852.1 hypothetical protein [Planctomycetaceae bacterium]